MSQTPERSTPAHTASRPPSRVTAWIPALRLGVALALHLWFGAMAAGWWFTEWLIARADESLSTDNMVAILAAGGVLWIAAAVAIVRLHPRSARLTWFPMVGWLVVFAALFLFR